MVLQEKINAKLILIYMVISISVFQCGVDFQMGMFLYYTPKYQCNFSNRSIISVTPDNCFYYENVLHPKKQKCQNWTFDTSEIKSTVFTEMVIICDKRYLQLILVPMRYISTIFSLFMGLLSDVYGRKNMYIVCCLMDTIIWVLMSVVPSSYTIHFVLRISKFFGLGNTLIGFVLVSEITPKKYRNFIIINYWTISSIGLAVAPVYVKYTSSWRTAWLLASWPMFFNIFIPFILLESPKWLIVNNRKEEAVIILKQLEQDFSDYDSQFNQDVNHVKEVRDMCSSGILMLRLGVLTLITFSFYMTFLGIGTNLQFAMSDIYINAIIMGLIEIPAGPLAYLSNAYFGSIRSVVIGTTLGMLSFLIIPDNWNSSIANSNMGTTSRIILASLAKFSLVLAWHVSCLFYLYLFPTKLRGFLTILSEVCSFLGAAVGGFIGYYFRGFGTDNKTMQISNIIYGIFLGIAITLFALVIPSIKYTELPNTVEEAKMIKKTNFFCDPKYDETQSED